MNKKDLIWKAAVYLRQNNIQKELPAQRATFRVTDSLGNASDFVVKKPSKPANYTMDDVTVIYEAIIKAIEDSLAEGEDVFLRGFGTFSLHKRKETVTKHPTTGEKITIKSHYIPKFSSGDGLKMAAKRYELSFGDFKIEEGE